MSAAFRSRRNNERLSIITAISSTRFLGACERSWKCTNTTETENQALPGSVDRQASPALLSSAFGTNGSRPRAHESGFGRRRRSVPVRGASASSRLALAPPRPRIHSHRRSPADHQELACAGGGQRHGRQRGSAHQEHPAPRRRGEAPGCEILLDREMVG